MPKGRKKNRGGGKRNTPAAISKVAPSPQSQVALVKKPPVLKPIDERKLHPIYNALDYRKDKLAMKLLNAAIAKEGEQPILVVLKALALQRSGHEAEALALCEQVRQSNPTEAAVLSTLRLVYKAAYLFSEITSMYEHAIKAGYNNEQMQLFLFWSLTREDKYEKMQQLSMRLFTKTSKGEYLFWNATNMLLQFPEVEGESPPKILQLARMLIERHVKVEPMEPEHVLTLVRVLTRQHDFQKAVDLISGPKGSKFVQNAGERCRWLGGLYSRLERYDLVADLHKQLLGTFACIYLSLDQSQCHVRRYI